jgi:hypothetical protein
VQLLEFLRLLGACLAIAFRALLAKIGLNAMSDPFRRSLVGHQSWQLKLHLIQTRD